MGFIRTFAVTVACLLMAAALFGAENPAAKNPKRAAVGKLGQLSRPAPIYTKPNKGARILYRGQAQLYVVLKDLKADWATLVMADGSSGYVEAKYVQELPYEVNVKKETPPVRTLPPVYATRGGVERMAITGSDVGSSIIREAQNYMGTPYVWGGNDLRKGVDCSGFVQQLFFGAGIKLPRTAQLQSTVGMPIDRLDQMQAGDRLYFTDENRVRITHTGLYMGNGYMIHCSVGNGRVAINYLSERWLKILVGVRR